MCFGEQSSGRGGISGGFVLKEMVGALGDFGTFVPIVIALVMLVDMDAATILVFAGLANIVTGLVFRIPIAVQPMKAIAALAIAGAMTASQVSAAGIVVGVSLLVLVSFGLIRQLDRIIPRPVLRAIQLTVAVKLGLKAISLGLFVDPQSYSLRPVSGLDGLVVLAVAGGIVVLCRGRWGRAALGLLLTGFVVAIVKQPTLLDEAHITLWQPTMVSLSVGSLGGIVKGAVTQMPLTLLNSVFAVSLLATKLLPTAGKGTTPTKAAISVGLMNVLSCPFGAMPVCHGAGGLAAQYAFGARSGLSMVILGATKIIIGLLFGGVALAWMHTFPVTVLAVFLLLAAITLGQASRFWQCRTHLVVAAITVSVSFATDFLPAGFAAGWAAHGLWVRIVEKNAQATPCIGPRDN